MKTNGQGPDPCDQNLWAWIENDVSLSDLEIGWITSSPKETSRSKDRPSAVRMQQTGAGSLFLIMRPSFHLEMIIQAAVRLRFTLSCHRGITESIRHRKNKNKLRADLTQERDRLLRILFDLWTKRAASLIRCSFLSDEFPCFVWRPLGDTPPAFVARLPPN